VHNSVSKLACSWHRTCRRQPPHAKLYQERKAGSYVGSPSSRKSSRLICLLRRSITQPCSASGDLGLASREKQLQEIRFALERLMKIENDVGLKARDLRDHQGVGICNVAQIQNILFLVFNWDSGYLRRHTVRVTYGARGVHAAAITCDSNCVRHGWSSLCFP
jgi:hypothetical protein